MKRFILLFLIMFVFMLIIGGIVMAQTKNDNSAPPLLTDKNLRTPATNPSVNTPAPPPTSPNAAAPPPPNAPNAPPAPSEAPVPPPNGAPIPPPGTPPPPQAQGPSAPAGPPRPAPAPAPNIPLAFLQNAPKAVSTAKAARPYFAPGKVWAIRAPGGEVILKAAIVYKGMAVGVLEFNPVDGTLLPTGYHPRIYTKDIPGFNIVKRSLPEIISKIEVLNGAEFIEPEASWVIPLAVNGMIVSRIKVYYDGIHVVPDFPANQEMEAYGK